MVHLTTIPDEKQLNGGGEKNVYGSKFAAQDLPRHEMPESEMPKEVAYRKIKDELSLDGNPILASFVTTYMEEEAEKLMAESSSKNFIDYEEYPQSADIQNRCMSQQVLEQMDRESIARQQEFIHSHHTASGKARHNHPKFRKEKLSLQGKTGKTHAAC
ncbi:hypothetical protein VTK26DRAFT_5802 [Humicola hyalothermophila]